MLARLNMPLRKMPAPAPAPEPMAVTVAKEPDPRQEVEAFQTMLRGLREQMGTDVATMAKEIALAVAAATKPQEKTYDVKIVREPQGDISMSILVRTKEL